MMVVCVHVPSYRVEVAVREWAGVCNASAILADKLERGHAIDATPSARRQGVRIGMTLVQAQAAAPDATILVHDTDRCTQVWEDVLDALDQASPLIDTDTQGTAYLNMHGNAGMPQDWIAQVRAALGEIELPFRLGAASNKFTARAAAIIADGTVCEPGEEGRLVAPLGIGLLEIEPDLIARLEMLGITTLGELAALPHGPFVRRFGSRAARWHHHAQGLDPTPFLPRAHQLQIQACLYGEGSVQSEEQVYFALRILVGRVHEDLARLGKRAALLHLQIECENGDLRDVPIRIAQPTADPGMLFDLGRANVEGLRFDSPITGLRLQAAQLESGGIPATLFSGSDPDPQTVELALARLESALGNTPARARLTAGNRLESKFAYDRFVGVPASPPAQARPALPAPGATAALAPPQLRLVKVHEIDVVMVHDLPAFVGSPPQAVLQFAGPWRTDETWFERRIARDEYDVLLEDGTLHRIFLQRRNWYVRGTYD